jgi:CheY-like chemotaxis protein
MNNLKNILLVEDNAMEIELISEALSNARLSGQVVSVNDGVEALEYLQFKGDFKSRTKNSPVVIFMDVKMPRMDGLETLQEIKSDAKLKNIPVVMLSSSREEQDLQKCYALGANAYIVKPVNFKEFINTIVQIGIFWTTINSIPSATGA